MRLHQLRNGPYFRCEDAIQLTGLASQHTVPPATLRERNTSSSAVLPGTSAAAQSSKRKTGVAAQKRTVWEAKTIKCNTQWPEATQYPSPPLEIDPALTAPSRTFSPPLEATGKENRVEGANVAVRLDHPATHQAAGYLAGRRMGEARQHEQRRTVERAGEVKAAATANGQDHGLHPTAPLLEAARSTSQAHNVHTAFGQVTQRCSILLPTWPAAMRAMPTVREVMARRRQRRERRR